MKLILPLLLLAGACASPPPPAPPHQVVLPQSIEQCNAQPELDWC